MRGRSQKKKPVTEKVPGGYAAHGDPLEVRPTCQVPRPKVAAGMRRSIHLSRVSSPFTESGPAVHKRRLKQVNVPKNTKQNTHV